MPATFPDPGSVMRRALELAKLAEGHVEPNPMVGAVIVDDALELIAAGHHGQFGGPHAEIVALNAAGSLAAGATLFVTLEPCCHEGKTGPCTSAIIDAGIDRVVIGTRDPATHAGGLGIEELVAAGIEVEVGCLEEAAASLVAPFAKLQTRGMPFVHAKWAMTLDGKLAAKTGESRWITSEASRRRVHELRGRMDAILVGSGTQTADDPLLTARPRGPRVPVRVVMDTLAKLCINSQLMRTLDQAPVIVVASTAAADADVAQLQNAGAEVLKFAADETSSSNHTQRPGIRHVLAELGRRQMTNVLVEGGSHLLGALFDGQLVDGQLVDELHVFIAPKVVGGETAISPVGGFGQVSIPDRSQLEATHVETIGEDIYIRGRLRRDGPKVTETDQSRS